jgi:hypothetical protein
MHDFLGYPSLDIDIALTAAGALRKAGAEMWMVSRRLFGRRAVPTKIEEGLLASRGFIVMVAAHRIDG